MQLIVFCLFPLIDVFVAEKTVALILARGGSRAIRLKNLQLVGSQSLLQRAINNAKLAGIEDVVVSTDHPLIALEALKSGSNIFHRSWITSVDWAPSIWGAAEYITKQPKEISILVLIQATSPFSRPESIRAALNLLRGPKPLDCVFSATRSYKLRWIESNGDLRPVNFNLHSRPRRQDWKGELLETGAFYITRRQLIEKGHFQNDNCAIVEVSSLESLEVDTYHDLALANLLVWL